MVGHDCVRTCPILAVLLLGAVLDLTGSEGSSVWHASARQVSVSMGVPVVVHASLLNVGRQAVSLPSSFYPREIKWRVDGGEWRLAQLKPRQLRDGTGPSLRFSTVPAGSARELVFPLGPIVPSDGKVDWLFKKPGKYQVNFVELGDVTVGFEIEIGEGNDWEKLLAAGWKPEYLARLVSGNVACPVIAIREWLEEGVEPCLEPWLQLSILRGLVKDVQAGVGKGDGLLDTSRLCLELLREDKVPLALLVDSVYSLVNRGVSRINPALKEEIIQKIWIWRSEIAPELFEGFLIALEATGAEVDKAMESKPDPEKAKAVLLQCDVQVEKNMLESLQRFLDARLTNNVAALADMLPEGFVSLYGKKKDLLERMKKMDGKVVVSDVKAVLVSVDKDAEKADRLVLNVVYWLHLYRKGRNNQEVGRMLLTLRRQVGGGWLAVKEENPAAANDKEA